MSSLTEALATADGLYDAAAQCGPDQAALAARLAQAAHVIRGLHAMVIRMHREHAAEERELNRIDRNEFDAAREAQRMAAARARWAEYENNSGETRG